MSWTERQGRVTADLSSLSTEELSDMLLRQHNILNNKRFVQRLPDKGKKISEFAERLRLAIAHREEQEARQDAPSFAEFQSKYQQAFAQQRPRVHIDDPAAASSSSSSSRRHDGAGEEEKKKNAPGDGETTEEMETAALAGGALSSASGAEESELAEALGRVSLSHTTTASTTPTSRNTGSAPVAAERVEGAEMNNYFLRKHPQEKKKAHFMEVLEKNEHNPSPARRLQFKPNHLGPRGDGSSSSKPPSGRSASPGRSPSSSSGGGVGGGLTPSPLLSAQARKERDRKHLDDITAARLPPLHHQPACLLSLEESANLLRTQRNKEQELQAKLAAQKLSAGLRSPLGSFHPDGGPTAGPYREVRDDGAQLSSEED